MKVRTIILTIALLTSLLMTGCGCPAPKQAAVLPDVNPCAAPGMIATTRQFPITGADGRAIHLSKLAPEQVVLNEAFDYRIKIMNMTGIVKR